MVSSADHEEGTGPEDTSLDRLTRDEDDDLRRLYWLSQNGTLSQLFEERLLERRLRDRRTDIRPPREFDPSDEREPGPGHPAPAADPQVRGPEADRAHS